METIRSKTVQRAAVVRPAAAPAPAALRVQASSLRVSSPSDPAEKEADATAKQVVRMAVPESSVARVPTPAGGVFRRTLKEEEKEKLPHEKRRKMESPYVARFTGALGGGEETVRRKGEGAPNVAANVAAEIQASTGSGSPLPLSVRRFMEPRFKADFSGVRVHTGEKSAKLNRQLNARAFAVGNQIFFGRGQFQPETAEGKELIAHELTHTVQQGAAPRQVQRSEDVAITQQAPRQVQRLGLSDALNHFARAANAIPGFRMFTIILGVNPINMSRVERSAANILRAMVEFIPGGTLIVAALDNYGVFDRAGAWVEQKIRALGMTGSLIKDAIDRFLDSLSWTDIFDLGGVWERAKSIFTDPIGRILRVAAEIGSGIIQMVKDAILRPLAGLAQQTRGYDLLKAVMGRDPITGDPYPRNADTLIGGFMKLIGQEEVWNNLKKANAVARAWAWFQGALASLMGFVEAIPATFMNAVRSLEIADIVLLPRAFAKVAGVFGSFLGSFFSWAGNAVWNLLEIVFDVVSPGAFGYIKKTGAALRSILRNPLPFVGNLVKAAKLGFSNFADRFGTHLKTGLIEWLTGSMPGIYIPKAFSLAEIVKFVFSVLGISWANIRAKLVKVVGETAVKAMETGFDIVVTLVTQGPAAAWDKIKDQLGSLKDMVIGGITDFVVDAVAKKAVPKLLALFVPGAGFISAILTIYDTVMVFVNKISKIAQVVSGFINSIVAIASGAIGAAASRVENTLAGLLSLAISFLAGFAGLGNVSAKLMGIINTKVRAPIDKALDGIIAWIVAQARRLGRFVAQAGVPQDPNERLRLAARGAVAAARRLTGRVTSALLSPVLDGLKIRYGLTSLVPYERAGGWWVRATINPAVEQDLGIMVNPADAAQTRGGLDLYRGIFFREIPGSYDDLSADQLREQLIREEDFAEAVYSILGITRAQAPVTTPRQRRAAAVIVMVQVEKARSISNITPWWRSARRPSLFSAILQRFVNRRTKFQEELRSGRVRQLAGFLFTDIPFISTTKNPARAAEYAKGSVVATNVSAAALPATSGKVVGKVFVYLFSGTDLVALRAADIRFTGSQGAIAPNARYSKADSEVTFPGAIPAANRVGEILVRDTDSISAVARRAQQIAATQAAAQGGLIAWS